MKINKHITNALLEAVVTLDDLDNSVSMQILKQDESITNRSVGPQVVIDTFPLVKILSASGPHLEVQDAYSAHHRIFLRGYDRSRDLDFATAVFDNFTEIETYFHCICTALEAMLINKSFNASVPSSHLKVTSYIVNPHAADFIQLIERPEPGCFCDIKAVFDGNHDIDCAYINFKRKNA